MIRGATSERSLKELQIVTAEPIERSPSGRPVTGVAESNWLPSPEGKPFSLTFRTYVPKEIVKRGEWTPPAV